MRVSCSSCGLVDSSGRLSCSGFVCLHDFKRKILAFVEIAVCAGVLLLEPFARFRTEETQMFLRQITHPSPSTAIARENRGPTGGFKPTQIVPHACITTRDCVRRPSYLPSCGRSRRRCTLPSIRKPDRRLLILGRSSRSRH